MKQNKTLLIGHIMWSITTTHERGNFSDGPQLFPIFSLSQCVILIVLIYDNYDSYQDAQTPVFIIRNYFGIILEAIGTDRRSVSDVPQRQPKISAFWASHRHCVHQWQLWFRPIHWNPCVYHKKFLWHHSRSASSHYCVHWWYVCFQPRHKDPCVCRQIFHCHIHRDVWWGRNMIK